MKITDNFGVDFEINENKIPKPFTKEGFKDNVKQKFDYIDNLTEDLLNREKTTNSRGKEIEPPPYSVGTFDNNGNPLQNKIKYIFSKILNGSATMNVLEGGVRGGKDVFGINIYAKVLMLSSEINHLALGVSLEHAIKTILDSNGFGIQYLIPHGIFSRSSEEGAGNRGVFLFQNIYGEERKLLFYGNAKQDDFKKFQGFTIGTAYLNEGINQHINGIIEVTQRTATSKDRCIIITQNPVGTSHKFYSEFERGYMLSLEEIEFIENLQKDKEVLLKWNVFKKEIELKKKKASLDYRKKYLAKFHKTKISELSDEEKIKLSQDLRAIQVLIDMGQDLRDKDGNITTEYGIKNIPIEEFVELPKKFIKSNSKLVGSSMNKIMLYDRGLENINNVMNGYDYNYFHLTMKDNIGMTQMQVADFTKGYDPRSADYKQRFLGERVSSDGILFPQFSEDNILTNPVSYYENNPNSIRVIGIDPAFNHPAGIVDCEVDLYEGTVYVLGEAKVELKDDETEKRSIDTIEEALWKVIQSRKKRKLPQMIIVDPSAVYLISSLRVNGFNVVPANNRTMSAKPEDLSYSDKTVPKGTKGIDLIRSGLSRRKFMFHQDCIETIREVQGMSSKFNEKTGNDDLIKVNDDMFDAFKYVVNTCGLNPERWKQSEVLNEYEQQLVQQNEGQENQGRNLERRLTTKERLEELENRRGKRQRNRRLPQQFNKREWWKN